MKKAIRLSILLVCFCVILLGCNQENHIPAPAGSEVWETVPPLTYGVLETEKLQVLDWNGGRCEATSHDTMAETEAGFYYLSFENSTLYYCDKTDFCNWVRVCNEPDCLHTLISGCGACLTTNSFVIKDNRIYHLARAATFPELYAGSGDGEILISTAVNGTDVRLEYVLEDAMITGGGEYSTWLTSSFWLYSSRKLTAEGQWMLNTFLVNADGSHLIHTEVSANEKNAILAPANTILGVQGENAYINTAMDPKLFYRVDGNFLEPVDLSNLETGGAYLAGDVLRCFKQNDGYYDVDLNTRQEIRLADTRMENSHCQIMLPNCIVEGTLVTAQSKKDRTEGMKHFLEIFDGEQWHSVALPPELESAGKNVFIYVTAVTSDSILFQCGGMPERDPFYRIKLNSEEMVLEACKISG